MLYTWPSPLAVDPDLARGSHTLWPVLQDGMGMGLIRPDRYVRTRIAGNCHWRLSEPQLIEGVVKRVASGSRSIPRHRFLP